MKITTRRHTTPTLLFVTIAMSSQVVAQTKSDQPTQTPTAISKPAARSYGEDAEVGPLVFRRLQQYRQLRTDLFADVRMSQEEKDAVSKTFEQFFQEMRENPALASRNYVYSLLDPQQRKTLEKRRREATVRGDTEKAARLDAEIQRGTEYGAGNVVSPVDIFLERLAPNFKPAQKKAYESVTGRWSTIESNSPLDDPLRMLRRSTRDPKLNLTDQQRQIIEKILKKASSKRPRGRRFFEVWKKLADKAIVQIVKHFSPEQNAQLISTFTSFEKRWDALVEFKAYRKTHPFDPSQRKFRATKNPYAQTED